MMQRQIHYLCLLIMTSLRMQRTKFFYLLGKIRIEAKEFYFLGEMFAQGEPNPIKMPKTGDDAFEINYRLDVPVREDIYEYIVSEA